MCGIFAATGKSANETLLRRGLAPIEHRGDLHYECRNFDAAVLGAHRLAIVSEGSNPQPAVHHQFPVAAVCNGEIYNWKDLSTELGLAPMGDTALIPYLWCEFETSLIERVDSEQFAVVIWDGRRKQLIACRDFCGVKPLFRGRLRDGTLLYASELKQLTQFPDCISIHEVEPGSVEIDGVVHRLAPSRLDCPPLSYEVAITKLRAETTDAVARRIPEGQKLGLLCSGGVDSGALLATAHHLGCPITAIALGYENSPDVLAARKLCGHFSVPLEIITPVRPQKESLRDLIEIAETSCPNVVRNIWSSLLIAERARNLGFKVLLCGEGADELFGGYNEFLALAPDRVNAARNKLLGSLRHTQLQRVDRSSMAHTVEIRAPYLDNRIIDLAFALDPKYLIGERGGEPMTKYIFRDALSDRLPPEIAWRAKLPLSAGAGLNIGDLEKTGTPSDLPWLNGEQYAEEAILYERVYTELGYEKFQSPRPFTKEALQKKNFTK